MHSYSPISRRIVQAFLDFLVSCSTAWVRLTSLLRTPMTRRLSRRGAALKSDEEVFYRFGVFWDFLRERQVEGAAARSHERERRRQEKSNVKGDEKG
ncbi:unnamed protein product [Linum trigynum]|uniref:Uncharacterized protein n=1 Tax=Linum trigynum TaxID=586398 RepID=A0AAV2GAA9_9ROSI